MLLFRSVIQIYIHMQQSYQHYALDANGELVDIHKTVGRDDEMFFCPHCHKEMITKRGKIRQWHFAHKTEKCSYDQYLHSIAELMIMDWFNKRPSIMLGMKTKKRCSLYESCPLYSEEECQTKTTISHDLKKFYSKCIKEQEYKGFRADLLCESEDHPSAPIFIEIFVTHECTEEKIKSGVRIIEFKIGSEEDIQNIVESSVIRESDMVRLYNFKREIVDVDKIERRIQKFILFPSLKTYVDRENYTCKNYNRIRKGIYEISMPYIEDIPYFLFFGGLYMVGKSKAHVDGYYAKDCQLCYWQEVDSMDMEFCKLYKKCGNPKYCRDNDAASCSMFRECKVAIDDAVKALENEMEDGRVDIWKKDSRE